jgi:hypothetical protein
MFAPLVELNGAPAPLIKRLIDDSFSGSSEAAFLVNYGASITNVSFIRGIKTVVNSVHLDPNPQTVLDFDLERPHFTYDPYKQKVW